MKRIVDIGPKERLLVDIGPVERKLDPAVVAAALGAEIVGRPPAVPTTPALPPQPAAVTPPPARRSA